MKIKVEKNGDFWIGGEKYKHGDLKIDLLTVFVDNQIESNEILEIEGDQHHPVYILFDALKDMLDEKSTFRADYNKKVKELRTLKATKE